MKFKPKDRVRVVKMRKLFSAHVFLNKEGVVKHVGRGYHVLMDDGREATFFEDELEAA